MDIVNVDDIWEHRRVEDVNANDDDDDEDTPNVVEDVANIGLQP